MPSWRRVFHSREAWIESMAGQCPPENAGPRAHVAGAQTGAGRGAGASDWPFAEPPPYPADDEGSDDPADQ